MKRKWNVILNIVDEIISNYISSGSAQVYISGSTLRTRTSSLVSASVITPVK